MSVRAIGHVWDLELPANKRLVLLAYADHADHLGENIWPAIPLIAWKTGYSERQVKRITKQLVDDGILAEDGRGPRGVKRYRLVWDAGAKKAAYSRDNLSPKGPSAARGDRLSPKEKAPERGDNLSSGGDILSTRGDKLSTGGDIAMSPKPSLEPSSEPSEKESAVRRIIRVWEQVKTGSLTPNDADSIKDDLETVGEPVILKALEIVQKRDKNPGHWNYLRKLFPEASAALQPPPKVPAKGSPPPGGAPAEPESEIGIDPEEHERRLAVIAANLEKIRNRQPIVSNGSAK